MADMRPMLPGDTLFHRRNAFLDLLLGLISLSERTVSTMVELAEPRPPATPDPARPAPPDQPTLR